MYGALTLIIRHYPVSKIKSPGIKVGERQVNQIYSEIRNLKHSSLRESELGEEKNLLKERIWDPN